MALRSPQSPLTLPSPLGGERGFHRLRRSCAVALTLAVAAIACSSAPKRFAPVEVPPPRQETAAVVREAYDAFCRSLDSMSASGDLTVYDAVTGKSRQVGIRIVAERGGRLYMKASMAMITALEITADGERFWFRLPTKKTVWTGPAEATPADLDIEGDERAPAGPDDEGEPDDGPFEALRPADIVRALLPEALEPGDSELVSFAADRRYFSLALFDASGGRGLARRRVWLERDTLQLARSRSFDENGDVVSESRFGGWRDGMPHEVELWRSQEGYRASFLLSKLRTNVSIPERAFKPRIPEGDKIVEVS